jgi:hypothetical protein
MSASRDNFDKPAQYTCVASPTPRKVHSTNIALVNAFPAVLRDSAVRAVSVLPENPHSSQIFPVRVADESVALPYRIYHNPALIDRASLSSIEAELVDCLLTRHHDGLVREEHLRRIISRDHIWIPPFVVQLAGEYVVEILQVIQQNLKLLNTTMYTQFLRTNPELLARTKQRVASYWNCYYRNSRREDYVGFRVLDFFESLIDRTG